MDEYDYYMIGLGVTILISAAGGWWATRSMKAKLEKGLGRKVEDEEVTSISAWMKADDKVVDSVIHDDSRAHHIQEVMEGLAPNALDDDR